jgi:hypothetical protein
MPIMAIPAIMIRPVITMRTCPEFISRYLIAETH